MPLISASIDTFIFASVVVAIFLRKRSSTDAKLARYRTLVTALLLLHSLYIVYLFAFQRPQNLFARLHLPLATPSEKIRTLILKRADLRSGQPLPDDIETLLTRLSSFDLRTFYIRFGQDVVLNCDYCTTFSEYALYSLSLNLLQYLSEVAVMGLTTVRGTNREGWRSSGVGALIITAIGETYWILTSTIRITAQTTQHDTIMWHDLFWTIRHLVFLLLPLTIHFILPASAQTSPLASLPLSSLALQSLNKRIQLLKYASPASSRSPQLRDSASEFWEKQRNEGQWARDDEQVRENALARDSVRQIVRGLQTGYQPDIFAVGSSTG